MDIVISMQFGLAPMDGVTNLATRLWFSLTSRPDFAVTSFLRVTKNYPVKRISSLFAPEICHFNQPENFTSYQLIPQIMGSEPDDIARISEYFLKHTSFVDINCGCPSPTVVGHRAGSGLLEKSEIFYQFTDSLNKQLGNKNFSIKMRSGFYTDAEYADLLDICVALNPAQLTLHGRTRADGYKGKARWHLMEKAAQQSDFPVVGSGDILDCATFMERHLVAPHVKKIIIGRGALRNPWIFSELRYFKKTELSLQTLCYALSVFALLHELECSYADKILNLMLSHSFSFCCENDEEKWEKIYALLSQAMYCRYIPINNIELDRISFAKIKMLWNYMRSSLPSEFMNPLLLRSKSFFEFVTILSSIFKAAGYTNVTLKYQSDVDWIYSGEKKPHN